MMLQPTALPGQGRTALFLTAVLKEESVPEESIPMFYKV